MRVWSPNTRRGLSLSDAIEAAKQGGKDRRAQNEKAIAEMSPVKLVRSIPSEDWNSRSDFHQILRFYTDLVMGDSALTEVLLKDVRNYAARKLSGAARLDESRIRQAADSILEEIATYHMHSDGCPVFHIYPGGELDIMIAFRSHYLTPDVLRHFDFIAFDVRSAR